MNIIGFFYKIVDLVYPQRCIACGNSDTNGKALCKDCLQKWNEEKLRTCSSCGLNSIECKCIPNLLANRDISLIWSNFYDKANMNLVSNKIIYTLKRRNNIHLLEFLSIEVSKNIRSYFENYGFNIAKWCISYPPRNPDAIEKYGYDHSKAFAKSLSEKLDIECINFFTHSKNSDEQKQLNLDGRIANATNSYHLKSNAVEKAKGRYIIFVDDIVTSGATVRVCSDMLKKSGAKCIIAVVIERNL